MERDRERDGAGQQIKVDSGQRTTLWTKTNERACGARNSKLTKTREREREEMVGEESASG